MLRWLKVCKGGVSVVVLSILRMACPEQTDGFHRFGTLRVRRGGMQFTVWISVFRTCINVCCCSFVQAWCKGGNADLD